MGKGRGDIFTLTDSDNIYSAIRICKRKDNNYEISRFCNVAGYSVVGGFSRLISIAQKELGIEQLVTFIDCRYGSGYYLESLGFSNIKEN